MVLTIQVIPLTLYAAASGDGYQRFKKFITQEWRPLPEDRATIKEFMQEQIALLRSLGRNAHFWEKQRSTYAGRGQFHRARCVDDQLSALRATSALARMYVEKLEQVEEVKSISVELFDELMRVGTVASSMTRLHEAISNCMIEIDMKERSVGTQRELYLLGAERRFQPYRFESHAPFDFASRPFR